MLKRDRTEAEKQIDRITKAGMMRLGGTNPAAATSTPFPAELVWDRLGRKGQACKIIRQNPRTCQVQFEDGFTTVINRQAIRRKK